jgi:hypothetical protein
MVKQSKTKTTKRKGPEPRDPETLRTERLVLRVHPDFLATLTERAEELRMTRSRYVEELLRGILALDPRNPRFDRNGKIDTTAPSADERRVRNPLHILQSFTTLGGLRPDMFPAPGPFVQPPGWQPPDEPDENSHRTSLNPKRK